MSKPRITQQILHDASEGLFAQLKDTIRFLDVMMIDEDALARLFRAMVEERNDMLKHLQQTADSKRQGRMLIYATGARDGFALGVKASLMAQAASSEGRDLLNDTLNASLDPSESAPQDAVNLGQRVVDEMSKAIQEIADKGATPDPELITLRDQASELLKQMEASIT